MIRWQLIEARESRGLSQEQLAEALEVDDLTIYRWEHGISRPQGKSRWKLTNFFGMTEEQLGLDRHHQSTSENPSLLSLSKRALTVRLAAIVLDEKTEASLDALRTLQNLIEQAITGKTMNNEISRREALYLLIALPEMLHHLSVDTIVERPTGEILQQCAAGITACAQLSKGTAEDIREAWRGLSAYLPSLQAIVQHSSQYRPAAASLVAQALMRKALLARHLKGSKAGVPYALQAVEYAEASGDKVLQITATTRLAYVYFCNRAHPQALHHALQAVSLVREAQREAIPVPALVQSGVYSTSAQYQALNGDNDEAFSALCLAYDCLEPEEEHDPDSAPIYFNHSRDILMLDEGRTYLFGGKVEKAYKTLSEIVASDTLQPKMPLFSQGVKAETINYLTLASLKLPQKDKERSVQLWQAGLNNAVALRSEQRFGEVLTAFDIMEALWANDRDIAELRQTIKHW
jgi:transcriptional regulator with XRE-family HTH domain